MDLTNDCGMNEFYRDLIQQLPDIVYKINSRGEFIYINDSVERLGYKAQELIGKHFSTIFHLEDIPSIQHSGAVEKIRKSKERKKEVKLFDERRTGKRITKNLRSTRIQEGLKPKSTSQGEAAAASTNMISAASGVCGHDRNHQGRSGCQTEKALTLAERHYRFLIAPRRLSYHSRGRQDILYKQFRSKGASVLTMSNDREERARLPAYRRQAVSAGSFHRPRSLSKP